MRLTKNPTNFSGGSINAYDKLQKDFDDKVIELQERCPHKTLSKWVDMYFAVGHSTGTQVRVCKECNKTIKQRGGFRDSPQYKELLKKLKE